MPIFILSLCLSLLLLGCPKKVTETERETKGAVKVNIEAENPLEWDRSKLHPATLFQRWREDGRDPQEICRSLLRLSGQDLTLFEEEISHNEANKALLAPCQQELKTKLEEHWKSVRP